MRQWVSIGLLGYYTALALAGSGVHALCPHDHEHSHSADESPSPACACSAQPGGLLQEPEHDRHRPEDCPVCQQMSQSQLSLEVAIIPFRSCACPLNASRRWLPNLVRQPRSIGPRGPPVRL